MTLPEISPSNADGPSSRTNVRTHQSIPGVFRRYVDTVDTVASSEAGFVELKRFPETCRPRLPGYISRVHVRTTRNTVDRAARALRKEQSSFRQDRLPKPTRGPPLSVGSVIPSGRAKL